MTMRPDPTFHASPKLAMEAPPESFAYTLLLSPDFSKPDALAVIDVKPGSPTFSQIVHTVTMPNKGDEFHHFGWNACSSATDRRTGCPAGTSSSAGATARTSSRALVGSACAPDDASSDRDASVMAISFMMIPLSVLLFVRGPRDETESTVVWSSSIGFEYNYSGRVITRLASKMRIDLSNRRNNSRAGHFRPISKFLCATGHMAGCPDHAQTGRLRWKRNRRVRNKNDLHSQELAYEARARKKCDRL